MPLQWATFPLLQLAFQAGDWQGLIENQTKGTTLHGASAWEKASVVLGKLVHYSIILALPALVHGWPAAAIGSATYMATQVRDIAFTNQPRVSLSSPSVFLINGQMKHCDT